MKIFLIKNIVILTSIILSFDIVSGLSVKLQWFNIAPRGEFNKIVVIPESLLSFNAEGQIRIVDLVKQTAKLVKKKVRAAGVKVEKIQLIIRESNIRSRNKHLKEPKIKVFPPTSTFLLKRNDINESKLSFFLPMLR
jgi:hypothetical protein